VGAVAWLAGRAYAAQAAGLRRFANIFSILVVLGFISIPIAVLAGYGS
jgi:hypothetical protein